jgi:DNA invertase Pin-like site-specific DNA recombinase
MSYSVQLTGISERVIPPLPVPSGRTARRFIVYLSVSTDRQGRSGLGLDAQREAVRQYLASTPGEVLAEYLEVESGKRDDRPRLQEALRTCQRAKATLLIAKLDRLARSVSFVASLMDGAVDFIATDMPTASRFVVHIMAAVAEHERQAIADRTRAALQAAKARGQVLGSNGGILAQQHKQSAHAFALTLLPLCKEAKASGIITTRDLADLLNVRGIKTREGAMWHPCNAGRVLQRLGGWESIANR